MLPESHRQAYQAFLTKLLQLQDSANADKFDAVPIQKSWQEAQHLFTGQILPLTDYELDEAIAPRWQSFHTEIYRTWRLVGTDVLFLGASRLVVTSQERLASLRDRLAQLIGYCELLLKYSDETS
jgi:hypothetical protein